MTRQGFTLLELLVVIAIIGILVTVGFGASIRLVQVGRVQEAAQTLAYHIKTARANSKSSNQAWEVTIVNATSYKYGRTGALKTVQLPASTTFTPATVTSAPSMTFNPPWGASTQYAAGTSSVPTFVIQGTQSTTVTRSVKVISVLGEVAVQ